MFQYTISHHPQNAGIYPWTSSEEAKRIRTENRRNFYKTRRLEKMAAEKREYHGEKMWDSSSALFSERKECELIEKIRRKLYCGSVESCQKYLKLAPFLPESMTGKV